MAVDNTTTNFLSANSGMYAGGVGGGNHDWTNHDWSWQDSFSPGQGHLATGAGYDLGSNTGQAISTIGDPLDLFGNRAKYAQEQTQAIARGSAERSINALRDQYIQTQQMNQPYSDLGTQSLANFGNYKRGPNFNEQLRQGGNTIAGSQAAGGMFESSNTGDYLAGFVNDLTSEDTNRQYQQNLNNVKIGQGAVGQIGTAGQNFGQGASSIYGNYGDISSRNALNYGQNRADAYGNAAQFGSGLANYIGSR